MSFQRVHCSNPQNSQTLSSNSQFAPRPFPVQQPKRPPTQEEIENQAFEQNKFEASGLQLKEQYGTITPIEQENLGVLQAKMKGFWAHRMERASRFDYNFATLPVHHPSAPVSAAPIQPKLTIGQPGDRYEQEADRVAEQVMRMPEQPSSNHGLSFSSVDASTAQRKCTACEEEKLQRKESGSTAETPATVPPIVHEVLSSPGQPLDPGTRAFMELRFRHDFSHVRVHTDARAAESSRTVNAMAYTVGNNVVFGTHQYAPKTQRGRELLAHELTHTIQQQSASGAPPSTDPHGIYESSAEAAGRTVASGGTVLPNLPTCGIGLSRTPASPDGFDKNELARQLQEVTERLKQPEYSGRDRDLAIKEALLAFSDMEEKEDEDEPVAMPSMDIFKEGLAKPIVKPAAKSSVRRNETPSMFSPGGFTDKDIDRLILESQDDEYKQYKQEQGADAASRAVGQQELQTTQNLEEVLFSSRTLSSSRGLDESMVDIYRDYQQFEKLKEVRSQGAVTGSLGPVIKFSSSYPEASKQIETQGLDIYYAGLRDRIEKNLAAYGITGIKEFESRIATFELAFRTAMVNLGIDLLERADQVCQRFLIERKEVEGTLRWNEKAKAMIGALDPIRQPVGTVSDLAKKRLMDAQMKQTIASFYGDTQAAAAAKAEQKAAKATQDTALDLVAKVLPQFPFIAWPDFPREKLLRETDPAEVMYRVGWYLIEHRKGIEQTIDQLKSNSGRIYKLDVLLALAKQKFPIADESIFDLIISDEVKKASEQSLLDEMKTALLFALMIVSIVVPGGVGVAAAIGSSILSGSQAFDAVNQYYKDLAAHKANLSSLDPSQFWVILAIIGAGLDAKGAIDLFSRSAALRKAMQGFRDSRELARLSEDLARVSELTPEARKSIQEEAEKQLAKEAGEFATKVAADARAARSGGMAGMTDEEAKILGQADTQAAGTRTVSKPVGSQSRTGYSRTPLTSEDEIASAAGRTRRRVSPTDRGKGARPRYANDPVKPKVTGAPKTKVAFEPDPAKLDLKTLDQEKLEQLGPPTREQPWHGRLEGSKEVKRTEGGKDITDIDVVENGVLLEEKTAVNAPDPKVWVQTEIIEKYENLRRLRARVAREFPEYEHALIGFRFKDNPTQAFWDEVYDAIEKLETKYGTHIPVDTGG